MEALLASRWNSGRCVVSSYFELARARQLCEMAHCMESAAGAMGVKYGLDDPDIKASRAKNRTRSNSS